MDPLYFFFSRLDNPALRSNEQVLQRVSNRAQDVQSRAQHARSMLR